MRQNLSEHDIEILNKVHFLVGKIQVVENMTGLAVRKPFDDEIVDFLASVSQNLMKDPRGKSYSDVITLGFWLRKASLKRFKEQYGFKDENVHLGRGIVFHIAPSNVAVNFAYSLVSGLLMGNANIVRVPSKEFPQISIIVEAINKALEEYDGMRGYIALVRYERDKAINDVFSSIADTRVIWGGDNTIEELRRSPLPPRSTEITFADRYSLALIDSDEYMHRISEGNEGSYNKEVAMQIAGDFYNDTYFSDQNACTSPRIVIWTGSKKEEAKKVFWEELHKLVEKKYTFQEITAVNKLTSSYLTAVKGSEVKIAEHDDNLIIRVKVEELSEQLMDLKDNCGFFFEYDCDDTMDLEPICDDNRCQTVGLIGDKDILKPLLLTGIKGIDRIVTIGHTMDFDLIWDGYNLPIMLTRTIEM